MSIFSMDTTEATFSPSELARQGEAAKLKELLEKDPTVATKRDESGRIPFHWAVSGGHVDLAEYLLNLTPGEINAQDEMGWGALMMASSAGHLELVRWLVLRGADATLPNVNGQTALHYAASKDHLQIAQLLVENGVAVNARDKYGGGALHRAASKGNARALNFLLSLKATQTNLPDCEGNTPLHLACEEGRSECAVALVKRGAHLDSANKEGKTPLNLAEDGLRNTLSRMAESG